MVPGSGTTPSACVGPNDGEGVALASTRLLDLFEDGLGLLLAGLDVLRKAIDRHGLLPYARAHYWEHLNKRQGATLLAPRDLLGSPTPDVRKTPLLLPRVDSLRGAWTAPDALPDFAEMAGLGPAPHLLEGPGADPGSPENGYSRPTSATSTARRK